LSSKPNIAVILLAAGASSRLGAIKQLLPWKGTTLLEHSIETISNLNCSDRFVVLGANHNLIKSKIDFSKVKVLVNNEWKLGLGSSIACGANHLLQNGFEVDAVLIILADQPLIDSKYLNSLIDTFEVDEKQIIATSYGNHKKGVPALFDKAYFKELSELNADKGAKTIIDNYSENVTTVNAEHLVFDIDTREDYEKLYKANRK